MKKKDSIERVLINIIREQKRETSTNILSANTINDEFTKRKKLFDLISPAYYDDILKYLSNDELEELFCYSMSKESIKLFFSKVSKETLKCSLLDLNISRIPDSQLLEIVKQSTTDDITKIFNAMVGLAEKCRFIEILLKKKEIFANWLEDLFGKNGNEINQKNFLNFLEKVSLISSEIPVATSEHICEYVISPYFSARTCLNIILTDLNYDTVISKEILKRLEGTARYYDIFKQVDNPELWFKILEKLDSVVLRKLKGHCSIIEVFDGDKEAMYDLFVGQGLYKNFWLFFTLEEVATIYNTLNSKKDVSIHIIRYISEYSGEVDEPYSEFYNLLSENECLHVLELMIEISGDMLEIAKQLLFSQKTTLNFYENLVLVFLESEIKE